MGAAYADLQLYPAGADVLDTASYSVGQVVLTVGGDALNEAVVIARLGHKARLVSYARDDVIDSLVLEHCRKNNTGAEYIKVDNSEVISINVGPIKEDEERTFVNNRSGSIWTFCPEDVERESMSRRGILSFASTSNSPLLDESLMIPLFERTREKRMLVYADIAGCKGGKWLENIQGALSYVGYFSPDYAEAAAITGKEDLEEIAGALLDCGVRNVIIKIGKKGYFIRSQEETLIVPAFADTQCLDAVDTGDNFTSGFMCGLLEGKGFKKCAALANYVASSSVESVGAIMGVRNREQMEARYQGYSEMER